MRLVVTVEMGNDAMLTPEDVAQSLLHTAEKVRELAHPIEPGEGGRVVDRNGNAVGSWRFRGGPGKYTPILEAGHRERAFLMRLWLEGKSPGDLAVEDLFEVAEYDPRADEVVLQFEDEARRFKVVMP